MTPLGQNFELPIQEFDQSNTAKQNNWAGKCFGLHLRHLKDENFSFFDLNRGGGTTYPKKNSTYKSERSELSFPLKDRLAPPVVRKSTLKPKKVKFSGKNSNFQTPLTRKILLTQRNDLYRRVPLVEYYKNPLTRLHLIFWNKTPHPRVSGCVACNLMGRIKIWDINRQYWGHDVLVSWIFLWNELNDLR